MGAPCIAPLMLAQVIFTAIAVIALPAISVAVYNEVKSNEKTPLPPDVNPPIVEPLPPDVYPPIVKPLPPSVRTTPPFMAKTTPRTNVTSTPRYVYRLLRRDEDPNDGLEPKDPNAKKSIEDHVKYGSQRGFMSQFISTTYLFEDAKRLARKSKDPKNPERIAVINLDVLKVTPGVKIYDLTKPAIRNKYLKSYQAEIYAKNFHEVIVEGEIPALVIKVIILRRTRKGIQIVTSASADSEFT